eukprot:scaffold9196_cov20-Tisochrysis_lutea.AAC.1
MLVDGHFKIKAHELAQVAVCPRVLSPAQHEHKPLFTRTSGGVSTSLQPCPAAKVTEPTGKEHAASMSKDKLCTSALWLYSPGAQPWQHWLYAALGLSKDAGMHYTNSRQRDLCSCQLFRNEGGLQTGSVPH